MNLPNKLTVLRLLLVPAILVFMLLPYSVPNNIIALVIFCAASITDFFDGKIARKYNLITDFGKFLDPLADKFMVLSAVFGLMCRGFAGESSLMFWVFAVMLIATVFRELAVASIRLVASTSGGVVVAANMLGKIKTVSQIACIIAGLCEPVIYDLCELGTVYYATYALAGVAIVFTILSGTVYLVSNWKYLDSSK